VNYEWNKEAEDLAKTIIRDHHKHLDGIKIAYLFKEKPAPKKARKSRRSSKAARPGTKQIWAKASRVPLKYAELLKDEFVFLIEFDRAVWNELKAAQQEALVDHELCHCGMSGDVPYMIHHDVEEFSAVIDRHGLWRSDVELFGRSIAPLFDETVDPAFKHRPAGGPRPRPGRGKPLKPGQQAPLMD
jgi:hypothetical protein